MELKPSSCKGKYVGDGNSMRVALVVFVTSYVEIAEAVITNVTNNCKRSRNRNILDLQMDCAEWLLWIWIAEVFSDYVCNSVIAMINNADELETR